MTVEVAVLGSPSLIVFVVSATLISILTLRAQELCDSRGGRSGLPVPNSPYGLCGRKATLNLNGESRVQGLSEEGGGAGLSQ